MRQLPGAVDGSVSVVLAGLIERAVAAGAAEPAWVAVEDPGGEWVRAVAAAPAEERSRGVLAAASEAGLVAAVRLGVGGALWLPPSLAGMVAALEAAAAPPAMRVHPDAWLADLVAPPGESFVAVSWVHRPFWRCQLGEPVMATLLAALAEALGVLPALLPWPALVMPPGRTSTEVEEVWRKLTGERRVATEGLELVACTRREGHCGVVTMAMQSLVELGAPASDPTAWGFPGPVHELPSGRRVGWWSPAETEHAVSRPEWQAAPVELSEEGFRWRLRSRDGSEGWVDDVLGPPSGTGAAIRIPGWIVGELAAGRPCGLFVERLAAHAQRLGLPLWVPNLRPGSLQFLLRLPGTLWVDGPAVPDGA